MSKLVFLSLVVCVGCVAEVGEPDDEQDLPQDGAYDEEELEAASEALSLGVASSGTDTTPAGQNTWAARPAAGSVGTWAGSCGDVAKCSGGCDGAYAACHEIEATCLRRHANCISRCERQARCDVIDL
jgi:hypothetical protein